MRWSEAYRSKITTADVALQAVQPGHRVWVHSGCANPEELTDAMVARASELHDVEVAHLLTFGRANYMCPDFDGKFRHRALFTGPNAREAVNAGRADYVPVFLFEIPSLIKTGILPIDVALIHVSPPDEHGFCSLGVGIECTKAAAENAKAVVALVNMRMPRALGDAFIHVSKLTHVVEADRPIIELPGEAGGPGDVAKAIGCHVALLIRDGDTLQMGIGEIPDAVLLYLKDKKHLGIHTEMFSDGVVELFESGVITGEKKTLHPGKIVSSFVLGTKKTFDFLDNNPFVEFHPSDYVNDPFIIARHDNMVAINSAISVDLTGQVNSDSIGGSIYSGFGGQVDFVRGAARARGGRPIIALPSTAKGGKVSRIVPVLAEGAGVVTTRADVRYIVTEFGVAEMFGRSLRERAKALIAIAHPQFRDELTAEAKRRKLL
ncbi:MAG: acetyl-CoA hydrolase/transferase family protein [Gemmatimonadales bacterium]